MLNRRQSHTLAVRKFLGIMITCYGLICVTGCGSFSLCIHAQNGNLEKCQELLDKGVDVDATCDSDSLTSLNLAAQNGHKDVVKLLLERGANIEAKFKESYTALYVASQNGHSEIVELLLENGADPEAKGLEWPTPLYIASQNGHENVVKVLLERGANVEAKFKESFTALYLASELGHSEIAELLLENGADTEAKGPEGATPLFIASQKGHKNVIEVLLERGADINAVDNQGFSPLMHACQEGDMVITEMLIDNGADMQIADKNGITPVFRAALAGHKDIMIYLMERGRIDMNQKSKEVGSLMHAAARNDHVEIVEYFIDRGLKPFVFVYEENPYDMYSTALVHQLMAEHYIANNKPCEEVTDCLKIASEHYKKSAEDFKSDAGSIDSDMFGKRLGAAVGDGIVSGVILGLTGVDIPYRTTPDISKEEKEKINYKRISKRCEKRHKMCNKAIVHYNNNKLDDMSKCFVQLKKM